MKNKLVFSTIVLSLSGIIAKAIGAFYKIPLTNIIGTQGMGLYYLIFPLYSLALVFSSSGLSLAVTRLVAMSCSHGNYAKVKKIFKCGLILSLLTSLFFAVMCIGFSSVIASFQGYADVRYGYILIAPSIVVSSMIAMFKAYFQGMQNMVPSASSTIVEQSTKLVVGLILSKVLLQYGVVYAVFGAIASITISEIIALVILIVIYLFSKNRLRKKFVGMIKCDQKGIRPHTRSSLFVLKSKYIQASVSRQIMSYAFAYTATSLVAPIIAFVDSFLIVKLLTRAGIDVRVATSMYGINSGIVSTLLSLPLLVSVSLSSVAVSHISSLKTDDVNARSQSATNFIKYAFFISVPMFVLVYLLAPAIISILYSKGLKMDTIDEFAYAYKLLRISSISIIYYSLSQSAISCLHAFDCKMYPFFSLLISAVVRMCCLIVLLANPRISIFGVAIADNVYASLLCALTLAKLSKLCVLKIKFLKDICIPIWGGVASIGCVSAFNVLYSKINVIAYLVIVMLIVCLSYLLVGVVFRGLTKIKWLNLFKKNINNNV